MQIFFLRPICLHIFTDLNPPEIRRVDTNPVVPTDIASCTKSQVILLNKRQIPKVQTLLHQSIKDEIDYKKAS